MNKLLIVFPYQITYQKDFDAIIKEFDEKGYHVIIFNDISPVNFQLNVLPEIITSLKSSIGEIEKIVVMSNIMGAVFSWYRCYNSLIDDFIYFIDEILDTSSLFKKNPDLQFLIQLINFNGITEEHLEGKIYLNLNLKNYSSLFNFFLVNGNFRFFDKMEKFDYNFLKTKNIIAKEYIYNSKKYLFELPGYQDVRTVSYKIVDPLVHNTININLDFLKQLDENLYFLPYIMRELYKSKGVNGINLLRSYFGSWHEKSITDRQKVSSEILDFIEQQRLGFEEQIFLLFLIELLKVDQERILKMIMHALLADKEYLDYHFPVLVNTLRFLSIMNFKIYDDYYLERRMELGRIADYFTGEMKLSPAKSLKNKRIAIHIGQLIGLNHSPTKVMIDYAKALKRVYPDYSVKIFVEDYFCYLPEEVIMINSGRSIVSKTCKSEHIDYLEGEEIEIFYSNTELTKKERLHQMIREIVNFDPEIIFTVDDLSLTLEVLYPAYPIVHMSLGGMSTSVADLYLYGVRGPAVKDNEKYKMMNPEDICEFKWGIIIPKAQKDFTRIQYNIENNDFVLVTVGNRLQQEMNESYLDFVISFLKREKRIKWFIVGTSEITYLKINYNQIYEEQIIMIPYEPDLAGFYKICDVFINPPRDGGGFSIAIAMNEGIPIVTFDTSYSCIGYMGKDNCAGNSYDEYLKELEDLYLDKSYWEMKSNLMKELIKEFDINNTVKQFMDYFNLAKEKFINRQKISNPY